MKESIGKLEKVVHKGEKKSESKFTHFEQHGIGLFKKKKA